MGGAQGPIHVHHEGQHHQRVEHQVAADGWSVVVTATRHGGFLWSREAKLPTKAKVLSGWSRSRRRNRKQEASPVHAASRVSVGFVSFSHSPVNACFFMIYIYFLSPLHRWVCWQVQGKERHAVHGTLTTLLSVGVYTCSASLGTSSLYLQFTPDHSVHIPLCSHVHT